MAPQPGLSSQAMCEQSPEGCEWAKSLGSRVFQEGKGYSALWSHFGVLTLVIFAFGCGEGMGSNA